MAGLTGYGIQRDDGKWYCGTADHHPRWRDELSNSGVYFREDPARRRAVGLAHAEQGRTFNIVPVVRG